MLAHVDVRDEVVVGGDEQPVLKFEQDVGSLVVNGSNTANGLFPFCIHDLEAYQTAQGGNGVCFVCQGAWEVDITACQLGCLLLGVYIAELHQTDAVVAEPVFFHEKRYKNAINVQHQIVCVCLVEDVIVKLERHFPLDTMRLA